jgi:cellulose synthase/poly-beta-1,6-N-acetylglucosamine synthase-like glycosyltransferase
MSKILTIIIPCRNEEKYIERCLTSLIELDFPKDELEIIVCDGKSTDRTVELVETFASKYPYIKLLNNEKQIAPSAMNIGIKASQGKFITRVDGHSEVFPDFIIKSLAELEKNPSLGCVGGFLINEYEDNISKVISYAMSSSFGVGSAYFRTGEKDGYVDTVAFGTYRKEVFDKIGLFDEELVRNQDDELNFRVIKSGYKIFLKRDINAKYYVRASFKKLFKQYFQYGYWKVYVNKKHSAITTIRQLVPLFFVLYLIFGISLSIFSKIIFYIFLSILILYISLAAYSSYKKTKVLQEILQVMYSFCILHTSYGLGYLNGLIDFFVLNTKPRYTK